MIHFALQLKLTHLKAVIFQLEKKKEIKKMGSQEPVLVSSRHLASGSTLLPVFTLGALGPQGYLFISLVATWAQGLGSWSRASFKDDKFRRCCNRLATCRRKRITVPTCCLPSFS